MSETIPEFGPLVWNDSAEMRRQQRAREITNAVMHIIRPYLKQDDHVNWRKCGEALYSCALAGGLVLVTEPVIQKLEDQIKSLWDEYGKLSEAVHDTDGVLSAFIREQVEASFNRHCEEIELSLDKARYAEDEDGPS